ncbi:MAG: hypothetical protein KKB90_05670 [Actinobacteria bacterium]|nr:hypothetical protein [Actinomycetota bacterium]MCG2818324.1 hypothetical protein [Actinomycetes bacterium]MBU4179136.1 hypothetical protein [Actinomycetota bacterium]MBU4218436.1 hypothetical protein [Actinomycetota bacterium]MBU4358830.1 hypothetical protein [Actinomycetota bacterium]
MGFMGKKFKKGMGEMADATGDLGGRTVVEFQTEKNVWEIADAWAAQYNSQPQEQSDTHRLYKIDSGMQMFVGVEIDQTETGYKIQGWMEPPQMGAMSGGIARMAGVPKGLIPTEMRLDAGAAVPGGMVMQNKPGMMFNQLLQALGIEQGVQAVSPQFQTPDQQPPQA